MYRTIRVASILAVAGLLIVATSCKKKEAAPPAETAAMPPAPPAPLSVVSIDLGKAVGPDKKVTAVLGVFAMRDTIYASVATDGAGENATIAAKWSYVKQDGSTVPVNESSQTISAAGPAATEFHIAKASSWPKGKYRVEVLLNGASAGTREFEVQ
jgi:hypothetical protein